MDNKISFRKAGIALAYPLAYLYLRFIWRLETPSHAWIYPTIFSVLFIAFNEIVLRGRKSRSDKRSYFWYVIMILTSATSSVAPSAELSFFALHLGAVYAVLISNDILVGGKTGELIWYDLLCGFFVKTFPNMGMLFADIREMRKPADESEQPKKKTSLSWIIPVVILFPFFIISMGLLSSINKQFGDMTEAFFEMIADLINPEKFAEIIFRMILAFPTCLFLYGLIASSAKSDGEKERFAGQKCKDRSAKRRTVSSIVMGMITGAFVAMYLLFFVVEFNYIFSGLMGRLPEGFNVVDYARRGFFELVGVMAINMFVYVIVNSFEKKTEGKKTVSGFMMIALMVESILFAAVSLGKLLMYFTKFGYTPKRMLAMWGTVILAAAAVVVIISVIKRKNHARAWIIFTACSYVLMCILSGVLIMVDYHGEAGLSARDEFIIYIENDGSWDISSMTVLVDDQMVYSQSNADGSYLIPTDGGRECIILKSSDLPEGSTLKDSVIRIDFYSKDEDVGEEWICDHYTFVEPREEDELSATLTLTGGRVRVEN